MAADRYELWWIRLDGPGAALQPAEVHFEGDQPVCALRIGEAFDYDPSDFEMVARIPFPEEAAAAGDVLVRMVAIMPYDGEAGHVVQAWVSPRQAEALKADPPAMKIAWGDGTWGRRAGGPVRLATTSAGE